jgi:tetratricopeptide (TPR) repeat protein
MDTHTELLNSFNLNLNLNLNLDIEELDQTELVPKILTGCPESLLKMMLYCINKKIYSNLEVYANLFNFHSAISNEKKKNVFNDIGDFFYDSYKFKDALKYYILSYDLGNEKCNYSIACCYSDLKKYKLAIDFFEKIIDKKDLYTTEEIGNSYYAMAECKKKIGAVSNEELLLLYDKSAEYEFEASYDKIIDYYHSNDNREKYVEYLIKKTEKFDDQNAYILLAKNSYFEGNLCEMIMYFCLVKLDIEKTKNDIEKFFNVIIEESSFLSENIIQFIVSNKLKVKNTEKIIKNIIYNNIAIDFESYKIYLEINTKNCGVCCYNKQYYIKLKCNHEICCQCYLKLQNSCPFCRQEIF